MEITDVLADVDAWTGFGGQLTHAAGATPRVRRLREHLHAALLAWGMNLGPTRMAESCELTYRQLAWATEWYLTDENLHAANDAAGCGSSRRTSSRRPEQELNALLLADSNQEPPRVGRQPRRTLDDHFRAIATGTPQARRRRSMRRPARP